LIIAAYGWPRQVLIAPRFGRDLLVVAPFSVRPPRTSLTSFARQRCWGTEGCPSVCARVTIVPWRGGAVCRANNVRRPSRLA